MKEKLYDIVLCPCETEKLTLLRLAATAGIHPGLIEQFVAFGLLEPVEWAGPVMLFDEADIPRLQTILRLRRDTGVNLAGIGMILDLVDRLRTLERENLWLRAQQ